MKIYLKYLFISLSLLGASNAFSQVGIGTNTPAASAALEVTSDANNKGILIPRITATQKDAISSPAQGLLIYQTTAPSGFYYYIGTAWKLIANQADTELKVDKVAGKDLSTNDYTTVEKTKLAAITGTNTGDQDLSNLATNAALDLKANTADLITTLDTKVDKVAGKDLSTNDYTTVEKTKLAAITGTNTGDQDLSNLATNAALDLKANTADLITTLDTKVDKVAGKDLSTNDYTTVEKTKLAAITGTNTGDQTNITGNAGTATKLATPRKINNVDFDGSTDITISSAVDAGAISGTMAVANGGTGATTVNGILATLGLANNNVAIGAEAGTPGGVNSNTVAIGGGAGRSGQGQSAIGIGYVAGTENQGANGIAIGSNTAQANQASQAIALGYAAGQYNQGANAVAIGSFAGNNAQQANSIAINATGASLNPTNAGFYVDPIRSAAGSSSLFYDATTKEITFGSTPSGIPYTGATASVDLGNNDISASRITGSNLYVGRINDMAISIGASDNNETNFLGSGSMAYASGGFANTAFGHLTLSETSGMENTAFGSQAMRGNTSGSGNTAIGRASLNGNLTGSNNTAIGMNTRVSSTNLTNATAIGYGAEVAASNQIQLGNGSVTNVKTSGTITAGSITYPNVSGTNGQVLTTDGNGTATWAAVSGGSSSQWTTSNNDIYFSTGKVGIGLTNPGSVFNTNLDVAGKSSFRINSSSKALIMDGSSGFSRIYTDAASGTPDNLILGTYPNGHLKQLYLKQSNGFVGINNDNPTEQLDVVGSIKTTGTIKAGAITLPNTDGTSGQVLATNGSGTVSWVSPASSSGSNFVDLTTNQTVAGIKTFSSDLNVNGLKVGLGAGANTSNTVIGNLAMANNTTGGYSVAIGLEALKSNTDGNSNTAIGHNALISNTTGGANIAIGMNAMPKNTIGQQNIAIGQSTLFNNTNASGNTVIGNSAAINVTTGGSNTIIGHETAGGLTTGSWNTIIGRNAYTGNISNNIVISNGQGQIKAQHNGTDWTLSGSVFATDFLYTSDLRLKSNVVSLSSGLSTIMQLKPVHYFKKNSIESTDYAVEENGFIAQEIQKILPFVVKEGSDNNKLLSVNYTSIIPLLTKGIQEQQTIIEAQQKQIETSNEKIEAQQKQLNEIKELLLKLTDDRAQKIN
jgi:hypothetical protein